MNFNPFEFKGLRSFSDSSKVRRVEYFLSENNRPGCIANHHFGSVILCLQKTDKFTVKSPKSLYHIRVSGFWGATRT